MTIHESVIARMEKADTVNLAAETIRRAITDTEDELVQSRKDIAEQLARIDQDQQYVARLEQNLAALQARLCQLESVPAFGVIPHHDDD